MKNSVIRVSTQDTGVLCLVLSIGDAYLTKMNWRILYMFGAYDSEDALLYENEVNSSDFGLVLSFAEVKALLSHVADLWDLLLIGQLEENILVQKSDDESVLFNSTDVAIEYFDCSYWTVASSNKDFINNIKKKLEESHEVYSISV